jgi:kynurenine formamidase
MAERELKLPPRGATILARLTSYLFPARKWNADSQFHHRVRARAGHFAFRRSTTRIIAPATLIPGTWSAGHIPPERLVAPLVVLDLNAAPDSNSQISLDDIAAWETQHGMIPQGAVVAIRRGAATALSTVPFPLSRDAAMFLIEARYTIGFAVETPVTFVSDRTLARQLALHGNYVVERAARFTSLPATGSLIIVAPEKLAPEKTRKPTEPPVRILAMIR